MRKEAAAATIDPRGDTRKLDRLGDCSDPIVVAKKEDFLGVPGDKVIVISKGELSSLSTST